MQSGSYYQSTINFIGIAMFNQIRGQAPLRAKKGRKGQPGVCQYRMVTPNRRKDIWTRLSSIQRNGDEYKLTFEKEGTDDIGNARVGDWVVFDSKNTHTQTTGTRFANPSGDTLQVYETESSQSISSQPWINTPSWLSF